MNNKIAIKGRHYPAFAEFKETIDQALDDFSHRDNSETLAHNFQSLKKE